MERMIKTFKASFKAGMVIILVTACMLLCGFFVVGNSSTAYAAETETTDTVTDTETDGQETEPDTTDDGADDTVTPTEPTDDAETQEAESNPTFLGRVWEYITAMSEIAKRKDLTLSQTVRQAIRDYIAKETN